jgi:hypothetical protein
VKQLGILALLTVCAATSGCATHAVPCDQRLQAINAPHPKAGKGVAERPSADAASAAAPVAIGP